MQRLLAALVALLGAISVAGLFVVDDDDAPALTLAEFQAEGNLACDRLMARLEADIPPPGFLAAFRRDLEDIGAPVERKEAFDRLVEALRAAESDDAGALASAAPTAQQLGLTRCVIFDAANRAAHDRLAQSELRNAFAAEKVVYTDLQRYTASLDELRAIEPALTYANGSQPALARTIYVQVDGRVLYLSARSGGGRCFYIRDDGAADVGFASDVTCGPAERQQYSDSW
jgi:hypothetical protein